MRALQTSFANSSSFLRSARFSLFTSKLLTFKIFFKFPIADMFFIPVQKPDFSRFSDKALIEFSTVVISSSFRIFLINFGLECIGFSKSICPFTLVHSPSSLIIFSDFFSKSLIAFKRFSISETSQRIEFSAPSSKSTLPASRS